MSLRRHTRPFDHLVFGVLLAMVPPVLALAADLHVVLSPESYPMACSPYPDFPAGGLGFSFYLGGRWYLLGSWAVPIALFLAVLRLWRVLSAFVVSSLVAFAACGVLESPFGDPVRRWVVTALQPDCPEEPRGWQADDQNDQGAEPTPFR